MDKPASNYPDVLGWLTKGVRHVVEPLQVAVASRPDSIAAGKVVFIEVLLQNALDTEVDALIRLIVPEKDAAGNLGRFGTPVSKILRIGMRAGEVGFASLPILVSHQAMPNVAYQAVVEVSAEVKGKSVRHVRSAEGGSPFDLDSVTNEARERIMLLSGLRFSAALAPKPRAMAGSHLTTSFIVLPPQIVMPPGELKASYTSLWTVADLHNPDALPTALRGPLNKVMSSLKRDQSFFPLLKELQARFDRVSYRLWAGEAVLIAKLMTLCLEKPNPQAGWVISLTQHIVRHPQLALGNHAEELVREVLFDDLLMDAGMLGFNLLAELTGEDFGTPDEMQAHLNQLIGALRGETAPPNLAMTWLPLALGGLVVNPQITMVGENMIETVHLFLKARDERTVEANDDLIFLFRIADDLIDRETQEVS
ncbi:MAG: hypothetical protein OHK0023_12550 [Anaerolineae bacterium]